MIERETRRYRLHEIEEEEDPDFAEAWSLLWQTFGPTGEMEREEVIREFLRDDPYTPSKDGTFMRYFLLVASDENYQIRGVRDGTILINQGYDEDLCVVYLSHMYMKPEARGTVLSYWLRTAPVEIAMGFMNELHQRKLIKLPAPESPGTWYGMRLNLAAEMEYFDPQDRLSWQRLLFYGRGGFDVIDPRHFPYRQPDFRHPDIIRKTGTNEPKPFALLVRRMGRERQARMDIEEAKGIMNLLYDEYESHCAPEFLENSLDLVLDRLDQRAEKRDYVDLLPLPTGAEDIKRLRRLSRYHVFKTCYPDDPITRNWLRGGIRQRIAEDPRYVEHAIAGIRRELLSRPHHVYAGRDKGWEPED